MSELTDVFKRNIEMHKNGPSVASDQFSEEVHNEMKGFIRGLERGLEIVELTEGDEPIPLLLFCPNCFEQHVDEATPNVCQDCGHFKFEHSGTSEQDVRLCKGGIGNCGCENFAAWFNPPHKSHRCTSCNHVWRPADVPTNGVLKLETSGKADGSAQPSTSQIAALRSALRSALERIVALTFHRKTMSKTMIRLTMQNIAEEAQKALAATPADPVTALYDVCKPTVVKIIGLGIDGDTDRLRAYAELLASKTSDERFAKWIRDRISKDYEAGAEIVPMTADPVREAATALVDDDEITSFNALSDRDKWDTWKKQKGSFCCPDCGNISKPERCSPFPDTSMHCGNCNYTLSRRTGGGQSDPFRWKLTALEDK